MTKTHIPATERDLLARIQSDIDAKKPQRVVIQAGHFPLAYDLHGELQTTRYWNDFSAYTLELGCQIAQQNPDSRLAIVCDDHNYMPAQSNAQKKFKKSRQELYTAHSGFDAQLPAELQGVMDAYGVSLESVLRQNQGKAGRESSLLISENILIADAKKQGFIEPSMCGKAYRSFIQDPNYFNTETDYLVSFVPSPCFSNICGDILDALPLNGAHAFYLFEREHTSSLVKERMSDLYGSSVVLRLDER